MPTYSYYCPRCGATRELQMTMAQGPVNDFCRECIGTDAMMLKRDYRADAVHLAAVPQATYIPAVGAEVSDDRQMQAHLARLTRESEDKLGYTPKLRARHPSEVAKDPGYAEAREAWEKADRDSAGT